MKTTIAYESLLFFEGMDFCRPLNFDFESLTLEVCSKYNL